MEAGKDNVLRISTSTRFNFGSGKGGATRIFRIRWSGYSAVVQTSISPGRASSAMARTRSTTT